MFRSLFSPSRRRRPLAAAGAALILAATVVACDPGTPPPENPPYWLPGSTATASLHGPLVRLKWDAPQGGDPVNAYQISLGTYNGTVVTLVPASVRDCYVTGLAANTPYTLVVTARDAQMHWSGPLPGTQGRRTTTITTGSQAGPGSLWCHADGDKDGLPDGWETNDGTYTGVTDTGSDPGVADSDNDGIPDGEEVLGTGIGDNDGDGVSNKAEGLTDIDLFAMGARPVHKDLLLELDWITTPTCPASSWRPTAATVTKLVDAFAAAPIENLDSGGLWNGINLIVDYGQGGLFTGGNAIAHDGSWVPAGSPVFDGFKAANHDPARIGVFHYAVHLHGVPVAESKGNDFQVWTGGLCGANPQALAHRIMHEMGHNLALDHGGLNQLNNKPNYNSVMNYRYEDGLDTNCDGVSDHAVLGYSRGLKAPLDETNLDERKGLCDGPDPGSTPDPIDWDGDGVIEPSVQFDINNDGYINVWGIAMPDHDDWSSVDQLGLRCVRHTPATAEACWPNSSQD